MDHGAVTDVFTPVTEVAVAATVAVVVATVPGVVTAVMVPGAATVLGVVACLGEVMDLMGVMGLGDGVIIDVPIPRTDLQAVTAIPTHLVGAVADTTPRLVNRKKLQWKQLQWTQLRLRTLPAARVLLTARRAVPLPAISGPDPMVPVPR